MTLLPLEPSLKSSGLSEATVLASPNLGSVLDSPEGSRDFDVASNAIQTDRRLDRWSEPTDCLSHATAESRCA